MHTVKFRETDNYMGRVPYGADLLEFLNTFMAENDIKAGQVTAIGAVSKAAVGYYDQDAQIYRDVVFDKHLEILNLTGNVSLKDGKPFVHAHATFSDEKGNTFGGHLTKGTKVFAGEFIVKAFACEPLDRVPDPDTGLALWRL